MPSPNFEVTMSNENTSNEELVCTCNDEFITGPCPVHYKDVDTYNGPSILDDKMLVSDNPIRQLVGHMFTCPECKEAAILHFFKFCPNCGLEVLIQSSEVTKFIRQQQDA